MLTHLYAAKGQAHEIVMDSLALESALQGSHPDKRGVLDLIDELMRGLDTVRDNVLDHFEEEECNDSNEARHERGRTATEEEGEGAEAKLPREAAAQEAHGQGGRRAQADREGYKEGRSVNELKFDPPPSTPKRDSLIERSQSLTIAANTKLRMQYNIDKGDDWGEMTLFELMLKLGEEIEEFRFAAFAFEAGEMSWVKRSMFSVALVTEAGDIINLMRFICDKYGALG